MRVKRTRQRIVVDADDRDFLGHRDAGDQARLQQMPRARIGHGDHADRLRQAPAATTVSCSLAWFQTARSSAVRDRCRLSSAVARPRSAMREREFALLRPAVLVRLAAGCTARSAASPRRSDACTRARRASRCRWRCRAGSPDSAPDLRYDEPTATTGSGQSRERFADGGIVEVGDDAVAVEALDAGQAAAKIFFEKEIPRDARRQQVVADAGDDLAVVDLVRVEQQRDPMGASERFADVSSTVL